VPLKRDTRRSRAVTPPEPPLSLRSPWAMFVLLCGAVCLVVSSSYALYDTDLWQHLAMGQAIWHTPGALHVNLWTWPDYGRPYFVSSWGFRALLWPLWSWGGIGALFAYRWLTSLAVFALLLATARAMGARGLSAVLVMVWCSVGYRLRTDVRPETLATVLFALELWLLERERQRVSAGQSGGRAVLGIVAIAWAWANLHISYYLGFVLLAMYLAEAHLRARQRGAAGTAALRRLWIVTLAAAAVSFANPYGWTALRQPFEFALHWRNDPLMKTIAELQPVPWRELLRYGFGLWPLLLIWRSWRRGLDPVEALGCALFTPLAISSWRFVALYFAFSAPFVARDLHELLISRRWPARLSIPARAVLVAAAGIALCLPEWVRPELPLGVRFDPETVPEAACDFMAAHGVQGRGFNDTHFGGYLAWRFPLDRRRLPFISTQPEYSPAEDRAGYVAALEKAEGWRLLDARRHFDYVLLERNQMGLDSLLDRLDQQPNWRMVFSDDAAELLVRTDGSLLAVADSFGYRVVPAGRAGRYLLGLACQQDSALRRAAEKELDRMIAASPLGGGASHLRGWLALMDGDRETARRALETAVKQLPLLPSVHDMLGTIALQEGRWRDALREFALERRLHDPPFGNLFRTAVAWRQLGDAGRARVFYRRELARNPENQEARDSLAALEGR
jgi:tetratricopeptide (TPR) repeat protein